MTALIPNADIPDGVGLLIHIRANLDGSSDDAKILYAKFIQEYADLLASESSRQEASARAPGARAIEITESTVIRARESLNQEIGRRRRPTNWREATALVGVPILSGTAAVMGSNLHGVWQWAVFAVVSAGAVACLLYLLKRRLL